MQRESQRLLVWEELDRGEKRGRMTQVRQGRLPFVPVPGGIVFLGLAHPARALLLPAAGQACSTGTWREAWGIRGSGLGKLNVSTSPGNFLVGKGTRRNWNRGTWDGMTAHHGETEM